MSSRGLLLWLSIGAAAVLLAGCGRGCSSGGSPVGAESSGDEAADDGEEGEDAAPTRAPLEADRQRLVDQLSPGAPLLPVALGRALVHAPAQWAADIVRAAYPAATLTEDNPRVNVLLSVVPAGAPVESVDARWDPALPERVGSAVITYAPGVDLAALLEALQGAATRVVEDKDRDWLLKEGGLQVSYYARDYEGRTRVAFEPTELAGRPASHADDEMKRFPEWGRKPAAPEAGR